jgi:hypothetical protein
MWADSSVGRDLKSAAVEAFQLGQIGKIVAPQFYVVNKLFA